MWLLPSLSRSCGLYCSLWRCIPHLCTQNVSWISACNAGWRPVLYLWSLSCSQSPVSRDDKKGRCSQRAPLASQLILTGEVIIFRQVCCFGSENGSWWEEKWTPAHTAQNAKSLLPRDSPDVEEADWKNKPWGWERALFPLPKWPAPSSTLMVLGNSESLEFQPRGWFWSCPELAPNQCGIGWTLFPSTS